MTDESDRPPHIGAGQVARAVGMADAIREVGSALRASVEGELEQPPRLVLDGGRLLVMAATHRVTGDGVVKSVSVRTERTSAQPAIVGLVLWVDGETGRFRFTADGAALTVLRTGAVSGLATDLLAPRDATTLAVVGAGRQARGQVAAVRAVRGIERIAIYSRTRASAETFAAELTRSGSAVQVDVAASAAEAVAEADVVCCATSAADPVLRTEDLPPTVHVNAVGSYRADMSELPADLLLDASVVAVDDREGCLAESGEVIGAVEAGLAPADLRQLGELVGDPPQRSGRTVFKSVGCAALDWGVASALARALPGRG